MVNDQIAIDIRWLIKVVGKLNPHLVRAGIISRLKLKNLKIGGYRADTNRLSVSDYGELFSALCSTDADADISTAS